MSNKDKRTGWIADLEVGSEFLGGSCGFSTILEVRRVTSITPTGYIVAGAYKYRPDGTCLTWRNQVNMTQATPEALEEMRLTKLHRSVRSDAKIVAEKVRSYLPLENMDEANKLLQALKGLMDYDFDED